MGSASAIEPGRCCFAKEMMYKLTESKETLVVEFPAFGVVKTNSAMSPQRKSSGLQSGRQRPALF
jgi:hypothetical protein